METPEHYSPRDRQPSWLNAQWIAETIRVWQPYYNHSLTTQDAIEIIKGWDRLIKLLAKEGDD